MLEPNALTTKGELIDADSFGGVYLIIATDEGEISLTSDNAPVLHTKNETRISHVMSISHNMSLIFSEKASGRGSATAYETVELQQVSGLTLHEVYGGVSLDEAQQIAAVFTPAAIRILKFDVHSSPKAKVLKTIELKGVQAGCSVKAQEDFTLLVATQSEYQLVSTANKTVSPLFPIINGLKPLMTSVGRDFLVVQGTGAEDPSMGLFVDINGEVGRQGIIIQWNKYPTSLAASGNHVFSVVDGELHIHLIDDSSASAIELKPADFLPSSYSPSTKRVRKLSAPLKCSSKDLFERLGKDQISKVESDIVFLLSHGQIKIWTPSPRLVELEKSIDANTIHRIEPDPRFTDSEQGSAELEYLSIYLFLHLLNNEKTAEALKAWRDGAQLNVNFVLYLYALKEDPPEQIFPGLKRLVDSVRLQAKQKKLSNEFLKSYLKTTIKKLRRNAPHGIDNCKQLELLQAKLLSGSNSQNNELTRFLLEKELIARHEILQWLYDTKKYHELENYYQISGRTEDLMNLWTSIVKDPDSEASKVRKAAKDLHRIIMQDVREGKSVQPTNLWSIIMELIQNDRVDKNIGISLLTIPQLEDIFDPAEILHVLKERTDSGEPWKKYLQHIVHAKGIFRDDLVQILINEVIKQYSSEKHSIKQSYERFAKQRWPKPNYQIWLSSQVKSEEEEEEAGEDNITRQSKNYPATLFKIQKELWNLMENKLDWMQLMPILDSQLTDLKIERAIVYFNLGLHEQCIDLLMASTDFQSLINYASHAHDTKTSSDLAQLVFKCFLRNDTDSPKGTNDQIYDIIGEFLKSNAELLDTNTVLHYIPDRTPLHAIADFIMAKLQSYHAKEQQARITYAVSKATSGSL